MNSGGFLFIGPLYDLVFNILVVFYRLLGNNLGLALIAIALASRLVMIPFTHKQLKNVDKNKEFQQKYEEIKQKYKNNKEKQTQELAKLQGKYLPGQLSGCFTIIIQLLILIQINYVIRNLLTHDTKAFNEIAYSFVPKFASEEVFDITFLGNLLNLGKSANAIGLTDLERVWPYLLIAGFLVLTQYFSLKVMTAINPKKKEKKDAKKKTDEQPSFAEVFQETNNQMMMFFPLMLGFFSLNYPSGLSLYFATTSLFVIIQQGVMKKDKIKEAINKKFKAKNELGVKQSELAQKENKLAEGVPKKKKKKKKKKH